MSELTPQIVSEVVAACQAGAEEAVGALNRSLDGEFSLSVGEPSTYSGEAVPAGFDGAGLAILFQFGEVGAAAIIPESSQLLPAWYDEPDPTGVSKLSTLSQELSMLLMPDSLFADAFEAGHVAQIDDALKAAGVADDAALIPVELTSGNQKGQLSLIWPLSSPTDLLPPAAAEETPTETAPGGTSPEGAEASKSVQAETHRSRIRSFSELPSYSRSLLKIQTPVRVVLASKKETVQEILELAMGSIIKFEKGCEEPLQLFIGNEPMARGDAVKVGDKFGFRVSEMLMPAEHFMTVRRQTGDSPPDSDAPAA